MGVPGWLLKVVIGFLTNRRMVVRYNGKVSFIKSLPGGGPQGTLLGLFLFLILTLGNKVKKRNAVWNISPDSTLLGVTDA